MMWDNGDNFDGYAQRIDSLVYSHGVALPATDDSHLLCEDGIRIDCYRHCMTRPSGLPYIRYITRI